MQASPIGAGMQAGASIGAGFGKLFAGNYEASVDQLNANNALMDGANAMATSNAAYREKIGEQIAGQGASGLMQGTGSALDTLAESRVNQTYAALQIGRAAQVRAIGFQQQASIAKANGIQGLVSGIIGAASGTLKGSSDYANSNASYGYLNESPQQLRTQDAAGGALQPFAGQPDLSPWMSSGAPSFTPPAI